MSNYSNGIIKNKTVTYLIDITYFILFYFIVFTFFSQIYTKYSHLTTHIIPTTYILHDHNCEYCTPKLRLFRYIEN